MDRLLLDIVRSYCDAAAWFDAAGRHLVANGIVERAAELLAGRAVYCEPEPPDLAALLPPGPSPS